MLWILGGLALVAAIAGAAFQIAVWRNGPAVVSAIDRVAGGQQGAEQKAIISTGPHPSQKLVVWGPEHRDPADAPLPVLLFAHGGGWRSGDPVDYGFIARAFVPEGFIVVLVGYRLGEDGKYPGMIEDTANAVAWTHEEIAAYGGDPDALVLAGHSAGAYNVVMLGLEEQWLGRKGLSTTDIAGVIGMAGPYDFAPFARDSTIAAFGHVDDPAITQPPSHVRADAPHMLLIQGEKDDLVRPRNARILGDAITSAGGSARQVFYPEMGHNGPLLSLAEPLRSRRDVLDLMVDFSRGAVANPNSGVPKVSDDAAQAAETSVPVQGETR